MAENKAKKYAQAITTDCIAGRTRLINRVITHIYDEALRPHAITVSQLNILAFIANLGEVAPGKLSRRLQLEKSTLSRTIDRMEQQGWIRRRPGTDDRSQVLTVTRKGAQRLEQAMPAWRAAQRQGQALLGTQGAALLSKTAKKLVETGI